MSSREPIFNAPPVVVALLVVMVLVHVVLSQLPDAMWSEVMERAALITSRYGSNQGLPESSPFFGVTALVTHQFLHGDLAHLGINCAWLLAFGSPVASRLGAPRFLAFFLLCGIAGALTFLLFHLDDNTLMVGASGALAGLMGGAFRFLFSAFDDGGPGAFKAHPQSIRRMSLGELIRDRRAQFAIGSWVLLNFLTALLAPLITSAGGIAWEAHLGGFFFGLLTFGYFDRPPLQAPRPVI